MQKIGILTTITVCSAIILGGIIYWVQISPPKKQPIVKERKVEEADIARTEKLLSQGKVEDALKIIHAYEDEISMRSELGQKWLNLLIEASQQTANYAQLILLYEAYPKAFDENEKASIMVANGYIIAKRPKDYEGLREKWLNRSKLNETWLVLDADQYLLEGHKEKALKLLKSTKFEGKGDIDRLIRLALLNVIDNPQMSWDYLSEAYLLDPNNSDIITYRAKLLESLGKDSLALYEYLAAIQVAPDNLLMRDQLAEYYMRRNNVPMALSVWLETLSKPSLDIIWIKALFWSKVVTPIDFDWSKAVPPSGIAKPFIEYLLKLPKGSFWDQEAFDHLPNGNLYLSNIQYTFWLRLLEALKNNNEREAWNLVQYNPFSQSLFNPQLEKAVRQILSYRMTGSLNDEVTIIKNQLREGIYTLQNPELIEKQPFFDQLKIYAYKELDEGKTFKLPQNIQDLLKSPEAFSAAFFSANWLEAGLELHKMEIMPSSFPAWLNIKIIEALALNRTSQEALAFATKQKKTPEFSLLIGELYFAENKWEEAQSSLAPLTEEDNEIGDRSALLLSQIYVEKKDYAKAKAAIENKPKLAEQVVGKEALARIALLEGNQDLADRIYSQLDEQSPEAMSYLARKAYADKNWKRAQELTEHLLLKFPDSPVLRDNLNRIIEEQKAQQP